MTFMAKGLMMILLLLAGSACGLAQSCIPLEVQPFDYTLDVHGTRYAGTAVVSPVPGEPVYELTAEGYTGVREDAERIYASKSRLSISPFAMNVMKSRPLSCARQSRTACPAPSLCYGFQVPLTEAAATR